MFQLALTFHGGMEVVAYEWGAPTWLDHFSPDDEAQSQIAAAYSRFGGGWSTSKPYNIGTMVRDSDGVRIGSHFAIFLIEIVVVFVVGGGHCIDRMTWSTMSVVGWKIGHMQAHSIPSASSHASRKNLMDIQHLKRCTITQLFEFSIC